MASLKLFFIVFSISLALICSQVRADSGVVGGGDEGGIDDYSLKIELEQFKSTISSLGLLLFCELDLC